LDDSGFERVGEKRQDRKGWQWHGQERSGGMSVGSDPDVRIRTGFTSPIAIGLAESLLKEAGIPFFTMDQNPSARPDLVPSLGSCTVRVPRGREAAAREILPSVEEMK
jgi:hypothetical protein